MPSQKRWLKLIYLHFDTLEEVQVNNNVSKMFYLWCLANPNWKVNDAANAINSTVALKLYSNAQQLSKYLGKPG